MNIRLRHVGLSIAVVLLAAASPAARAWDEAISTQDPGNTDPGFGGGGGLNPPWQNPGAAAIPNVVGTKFWVAIQNYHIPTNVKTVSLTINVPPGNDLKCNSVSGYYNGGANQSNWVGNRVTKKDNGDGTVTFTATLDPQPDWEVFELEIIPAGGDAPRGEYVPEPDGHSNCVHVGSDPLGLDISDGHHDGLDDFTSIPTILVVPELTPVDLDMPPYFNAPPSTGTWYGEYVFEDPDGEPLPQGAVRFSCDGPGLQSYEDVFEIFVPMMGPEEWYFIYMFDVYEGRWQFYLLHAGEEGPECPGDIDGDGDVDLGDLAILLASYGTVEGDAGYNPAADLDGDGTIGLSDLAMLLSVYGMICE